MAKKEKPGSDVNRASCTLDDILVSVNEQCGEGTMFAGTGLKKDPLRLPFGVFAVDFATGGGVPIWGTCCLWGPESGGKSSLCGNAIASSQRLCWNCFNLTTQCKCSGSALEMDAVYGDIEGTLDRTWLQKIGADPDRYKVVLADYGEQYANIFDSVLRADNCGLLVVDSLASLVPVAEMEAAAEDDFYALQARLIGRLVRKLKQRLIRERKRGHPCAIIFVNQLRMKIGMTFGNPETMPGGHGMKHEFSLLLRCVKKSLSDADSKYKDKKKDKAVRHAFSIRKEKVLTLAGTGEYLRIKQDIGDLDLTMGDIGDQGTVLNYAKEYGIVTKQTGKKPWRFMGMNATRLDDIKRLWATKPEFYYAAQMEIVKAAKERLRGADKDV